MPVPPLPIDGLLIIDKPAGWTSHDVVARLRRLTGIKRIGHAGTLDPLATGVLIVGVGQGTRVLEYLVDADKRYRATIKIGEETTTYDADGEVVATAPWQHLSEQAMRAALSSFEGAIRQRPPAFSAIKRDGVPLHRLARAGQPIEAPERTVEIYAIDNIAVALPFVHCEIHCSKGTYVRSIAHDLGSLLGCGGHITALRRISSGDFSEHQAVTLAAFEAAIDDGSWSAFTLAVGRAVAHLPAVTLDAEQARRLRHGVPPAHADGFPSAPLIRALGPDGDLIAIVRQVEPDGGWVVAKVLEGR